MNKCAHLLLALSIMGPVAATVKGQPPAPAPLPAKEGLPEGVIARLGEARFRNSGRPFSLVFSPHSKFLVAGAWDGTISCWDLDTLDLLSEWQGHAGPVHALAISPDSKTLASAGEDNEIRVWRLANSEQTIGLPGHKAPFKSLRFAPDGSRLMSTDLANLMVWNLPTEQPLCRIIRNYAGFGGGGAFQGNSSLVFTTYVGNGKPSIEIADPSTGKVAKKIDVALLQTRSHALSDAGKWFVALPNTATHGLHVMQIATGNEMQFLHAQYISGFALSPDERSVLIHDERCIAVLELTTGLIRRQFKWQSSEKKETCFALSPDGRFMASGNMDHSVLLWDLTGQRVKGTLAAATLSAQQLDRLWADLDANDGDAVHRAVWTLAAGVRDSVPYLRGKLIVPPGDNERIAKLMHDLEDDVFKVRVEAELELEKLGLEAEPALRKMHGAAPSLEGRRRIEKLLDLVDRRWNKSQMLRVIEALERGGTPEARQLLQELAERHGNSRRGDEAKTALQRLQASADGARR